MKDMWDAIPQEEKDKYGYERELLDFCESVADVLERCWLIACLHLLDLASRARYSWSSCSHSECPLSLTWTARSNAKLSGSGRKTILDSVKSTRSRFRGYSWPESKKKGLPEPASK